VVLRGAFGDDQPLGDLPVGEALGDQLGDLGFARAQRGGPPSAVEVRDECTGAVGVRRDSECSHDAVGIAGDGLGAVAIARIVAREQRRREVVTRFGDESGGTGTVSLLDRDREVVNREIEAAQGGGAASEGELDRAHVGDCVADRVLAAERFEPVEQHGEVVVPAEVGSGEGAVDVPGEDEKCGK
jgi:hypothetical protein